MILILDILIFLGKEQRRCNAEKESELTIHILFVGDFLSLNVSCRKVVCFNIGFMKT